MRRPPNLMIFAVVAAAGLAAFGAPPQSADPARRPGEDVLCAIAIYSALAEASRRCAPDTAPDIQTELRLQVERLDAYALANGMTAESLAAFKSQHVPSASDPAICEMYRRDGFEEALEIEPGTLRTYVDGLTAQPGTPTWGDCV